MTHPVLRGSGATEENARTLSVLEKALPVSEYRAVASWLTTFYGYQQTWILDQSRFSILLKCRQIGASHTYAAAAVLWGLFGEDTSIVSIGERESTEVLKKVAKHAQALSELGSVWAKPRSMSALRVTFGSGGTVSALPSTSGGRGQSGHVLLDEAAYFEHSADVMDAAAGSVLHGYKLRLMSTPNGVGNMFHKAWVDAKKNGYRKHVTTLHDAIGDGLLVNIDDCRKMAMGDERLFAQLFLGSFLDGNLQYIPDSLVQEAAVDDLYTYEGDYFGGLDIGRTVDRTVLVVLRKRPDEQRILAWMATCKRTDSDQLEALVAWAFDVFKLRRLCVDSTGIGAFPAERMQKKHGLMKVEPVVFSQPVKEDLATTLYSAFAEKNLKIAKTNKALALPRGTSPQQMLPLDPGAAEMLREDVCAIRREITTAGNVRYDAPHTDEGHADSAWALALALHACGRAPGRRHEIAPQSADTGVTLIT